MHVLLLLAMSSFVFYNSVSGQDLGDGVVRKILAHDEKLMMVEVSFDAGAVGALHNHEHEQVCYVLEGLFEFTIGDETRLVGKGDSLHFSSMVMHGTRCLEAGRLLDVFTPCRMDFLS